MCTPHAALETPKTVFKAAVRFVKTRYRTAKQNLTSKTAHQSSQDSDASGPQEGEITAEYAACQDTITFDNQLTVELKGALLQNRKIEVEQARTTGLFTFLDRRWMSLNNVIYSLRVEISRAKSEGPDFDSKVKKMEARLSSMKEQLKQLDDERESLQSQLADLKEDQREILAGVFISIDSFCIDRGIIDDPDQDPQAIFEAIVNQPDEVAIVDSESASSTSSASKKPRSNDSELVNAQSSSPKGAPAKSKAFISEVAATDPKLKLKNDYDVAKTFLRLAEVDFELRYERFHEEEAEFERVKAAAGKKIGPKLRLKMDMCELQETRRLVQALQHAEDELARAKEACRAGNVIMAEMDIDMESGFCDDIEDGYRMSEENDMIKSVDPAQVHSWLSQMPDVSDIEQDILSPTTGEETQVDDWDAKSVEIEDSLSMVADGAERRRILKWRAACYKPNFDEWFSTGWDGGMFWED